jgi:peptidoglycan DL-endopeptidase CwlO
MKLLPLKVPWRGKLIRNKFRHKFITKGTSILTIAVTLFVTPGIAYADSFDDQIAALRAQAAQQQNQAAALHGQANNYRTRVAQLQAQINALRSQIGATQLKSQRVTLQIEDAKAKMAGQKVILSENIKNMYLDSNVTPLEMLASSSDIGDFFNQQAYQDKVKDKVIAAMASINELKTKLETEQANLQRLMADMESQRQQVQTAQAEANNLLAIAASNAAAADAQVKNANSQITSLRSQQAAILAARFGGRVIPGGTCGGGYPSKWCSAPKDALVDNWGMYNRECVSYVAFKVWQSGRNMPYWGGRGNANQWPGNARAAGIPVDGNPRVGDAAVTMAGPYGHVMYVEAVLDGGSKVAVSQYNFGNNGEYSTMTIPSSGVYFIHF